MSNSIPPMEGPVCPVPLIHKDQIVMGHGSGGKMSQDLIRDVFLSEFNYPPVQAGNDFASTLLPEDANLKGKLSISTDAHIVTPLFFPGGDIGRLAISGTVNDMSMSGAIPLYLTASFIIEEGLDIQILHDVASSMRSSADESGVQIVAGDTKVAEKGQVDKLFITTSGIGWIPDGIDIHGANAQVGDVVIVSGTIGDHGIAVLSARGDLGFQASIESDVAPLNHLIHEIIRAAPNVHVLRDPTRGGLATTLNEIARQSQVGITIDHVSVPVRPAVQSACEMLGFDPLYVANEGKLIVILPEEEAKNAISAMQNTPYGKEAAIIGKIVPEPTGRVLLRTLIGGTRVLDVLSGEMLPRIC